MTKEEAVKEIEKAFEPAFANYIITALTEGATVSDKDPTTKNDLGVDCINRQAAITFVCKNIKEILKDTTPLEVKLSDDYIYENVAKIMRNPKVLPSVTPQEPKTGYISIDDVMSVFDDFMCGDVDEEGVETFWEMLKDHEKSISTAFKHLRECSCCKCYFDWLMPRNSFCPNCGADMREGKE